MERIKQQIEALREQADALASTFGGKKTQITVKLINNDNTQNFSERESEAIDKIMTESGLFSDRSAVPGPDGTYTVMYHLKHSYDFYIMFYVK